MKWRDNWLKIREHCFTIFFSSCDDKPKNKMGLRNELIDLSSCKMNDDVGGGWGGGRGVKMQNENSETGYRYSCSSSCFWILMDLQSPDGGVRVFSRVGSEAVKILNTQKSKPTWRRQEPQCLWIKSVVNSDQNQANPAVPTPWSFLLVYQHSEVIQLVSQRILRILLSHSDSVLWGF